MAELRALDEPLTDPELDELEGFLASDLVPQDCMDLEMLDGFLTAIVSGPESVQPSEWLPQVWSDGGRSSNPAFRGSDQAQRIMGLMLRHMVGIQLAAGDRPACDRPLLAACSAYGAMPRRFIWHCWTRRSSDVAVISYTCKSGKYPSVAARHPPAVRLERAIRDLFGLDAVDTLDARPWLDLGFWSVRHPLGKKGPARKPVPYKFLPAEGEGLHQIPVGPVHAGIIEPGHFRFTANGEHVVRLEQRLGWVHKGIESLMHGATLEEASETCVAHFRGQHGRLRVCIRTGGGSCDAGQSTVAREPISVG